MTEVRFHPEARGEYAAALRWYEARSLQAALRFDVETDRVLALIAASPLMFPVCDDDEHRHVMLRKFPYSLIYRVNPDHLEVVAVAHASRAAGYWQGRS